MKKVEQPYTKKIGARLTEKQYKAVAKNARASKMSIADYIRACVL
jgi:predicted HicB family RNase H-like nuclease